MLCCAESVGFFPLWGFMSNGQSVCLPLCWDASQFSDGKKAERKNASQDHWAAKNGCLSSVNAMALCSSSGGLEMGFTSVTSGCCHGPTTSPQYWALN